MSCLHVALAHIALCSKFIGGWCEEHGKLVPPPPNFLFLKNIYKCNAILSFLLMSPGYFSRPCFVMSPAAINDR